MAELLERWKFQRAAPQRSSMKDTVPFGHMVAVAFVAEADRDADWQKLHSFATSREEGGWAHFASAAVDLSSRKGMGR